MRATSFYKLKNMVIMPIIFVLGITMNTNAQQSEKGEPPQGNWGPVSEGCQLSIQLDKAEFEAAAEAILLKIFIKNSSKKPLHYSESYVYRDFSITVKREKDKDVPLTEFGKNLLEKPIVVSRNIRMTLEPGEKREYSLLVNRVYDMTLHGTYFITVKCSVMKQEGKGDAEVISNTIEVKIK